jgi:hypothetical protein
MTFSFDIIYLDGALKGLVIPQSITTGSERDISFYRDRAKSGEPVKAIVTGKYYKISNVRMA